jgi:valyl-tRNA synthetase
MPFITEELYQNIKERSEKESIMVSLLPTGKEIKDILITKMETTKNIIAGIRNIRAEKGISPRETFNMFFKGDFNESNNAIIMKLANIDGIATYNGNNDNCVSFIVGTTEISIPLGNNINAEEEIAKMENEIKYLEGFLVSVEKKLNNEKFVANAKPEVVENERKKKADAESKIATLKANIASLK